MSHITKASSNKIIWLEAAQTQQVMPDTGPVCLSADGADRVVDDDLQDDLDHDHDDDGDDVTCE